MFNSVYRRVSSTEDTVRAITTMLYLLHENMTDMVKKHVTSGVVGNSWIPWGMRRKGNTPGRKYLAFMTNRLPHLSTIFNQGTVLQALMGSVMGQFADHVMDNSLSPKRFCSVLDRYFFPVKREHPRSVF